MTVALAIGVVLLAATLYANTGMGLASEWASSPDASYGLLLVTVAATVAWKRRHLFLLAARSSDRKQGGLALLVLGVLMYLAGVLGADVFITRLSAVAVLAGSLWYVAGAGAARTMIAPLAFLLMAIPPPTLVVNAITLPLQLVASRIAEATLAAAAFPVFRDGNVLELPSTTLQVAEACSGLRSLVSLLAVGTVLAWASDRSTPRRAAIVSLAVPVAIVANGIRIAATGVACETWGPQMASGRWHTITGWITFAVATFVLVQLARVITRASGESHTVRAPEAVGV